MKSIGITELRRDMANVLKVLKATKEAILITRRGMPVAVFMSVEVFEKMDHDRRLLRLLSQGGGGPANHGRKLTDRLS